MRIATIPRPRKISFENDMKCTAGPILEEGWASKECRIKLLPFFRK
jgi:hypothetical protein